MATKPKRRPTSRSPKTVSSKKPPLASPLASRKVFDEPRGTYYRRFLAVRPPVALLFILAVVYAGAAFWGSQSQAKPTTLNMISGAGTTRVGFSYPWGSMGVYCGCEDPTYGGIPWVGVNVPASSFSLRAAESKSAPWMLTLQSTPVEKPPDWHDFGEDGIPLAVRVTVDRGDQTLLLRDYKYRQDEQNNVDDHGVHQVTLLTTGAIEGAPRDPQISIIPRNHSTLTLKTTEGPQDYAATTMSVRQTVAAVTTTKSVSDPAPLLDVSAGIALDLTVTDGTRLFVGSRELTGLKVGDQLHLAIDTLFSVRVKANPVPSGTLAAIKHRLSQPGQETTGMDAAKSLGALPITDGALPKYTWSLSRISSPSATSWQKFSEDSTPKDGKSNGTSSVSSQRSIDFYGQITRLEGRNILGSVEAGSDAASIALGQNLNYQFATPFNLGKWKPTMRLSAGSEAISTSISGRADVRIGGALFTRHGLPAWVLGAFGLLAGALIGVVLDRIFRSDSA